MARRNKTPPDFLTPENTDNNVSGIEKSLGIAPREQAPAVPAPSGNPLVDLQGTADFEQAPASRASEDAAIAKTQEEEDAQIRKVTGAGDFYRNVVGNDFSLSAMLDMAKEQGFEPDQSYQLPSYESEGFKELTREIPEEYWSVFDNSISADHAQWIAEKTRRELDAEREMAAFGGAGIAGRLALNILDPVGVAIGAATGSLGWASKGTRISRAIKSGLLAGGENAALQLALSDQRATQDGWDVANAAVAGIVIGGLAGRYLDGKQKDELQLRASQAQRALDREEAKAAAADAGVDLSGTKWRDSGGAARVDESVLVRPLREMEADELDAEEVGQSVFAGARFDIASVLRGDSDEYIRGTFGLMTGEPAGVKSGVNHIGASERAQRLHDSWLTQFYDTAEPAYERWARAGGYNSVDMQSRAVRDEFMTAVGRYVDGSLQTEDKNIIAVGKVVRQAHKDILARAKNAAVDGFEDVAENENYLSRVQNLKKFREYEKRFGTGKMEEAIEESFKRGARGELDDRTAAIVAKAYVKRLKQQAAGFEPEMLNGLRLTDVDYVKGLLKDVQADSDTVAYVENQLKHSLQDRGTGSSSVRHGKRRVSLDETTRFKMVDQQTGEEVEWGINEIFERNVEKLLGRYTRTMSGHIGLAEVAGIKGKRDFDAIRQNIISKYEYADVKRRAEIDRVLKTADETYKLVTGLPTEDAAAWHKYGRLARDWNFMRVMNQVGFAQVADMAGWMAGGYAREALKHFPAIRQIMRDVKAGAVDKTLARELKVMLSVATDYQNNTAFSFSEEMFMDTFDGAVGKLQHGARIAGRATQRVSGMKFINELNQMMAGHVVAQKLIDVALGNTSVSEKRLLDMGLSPAMVKKIGKEAAKTTRDADGTLRALNIHSWKPEVGEAFLDAAYRESRRIVQEEDLGETHSFMHKSTGKVLLQFRRFAIASYTKQMLKGIHMRDARAATQWITSMMLGGAAFVAQQSIRLSTKSDEERRKYVNSYGGWTGMFIKAGFSRANFSSLAPGAIDSIAGLSTGTAVFNTRSTGLDSNFLTGNPTYDLIVRGVGRGLLSGPMQATLRGDKQYKQSDAKALLSLLPFQNALGVQNVLDLMSTQLPQENTDDDPNSVDWF